MLALKNQEKIDLGVATHISDDAATMLTSRYPHPGYNGCLNLNGLVTISERAAKALSEHKHALFLNGLVSIDVALAKALSKRAGGLSLNGIREIDVETARALSFSYNGINPTLVLSGLRKISVEVAHELARTDGLLILNGLDTVSEDVARALSKNRSFTPHIGGCAFLQHSMSLTGLAEISDTVAEIWSTHRGEIFLDGLKSTSLTCAKFLAMNHRIHTKLALRSMVPIQIGINEANHYLRSPESIDFSQATHVSVDAAEILSGHEELFNLDGITSLLEEAAKARARGAFFIGVDLSSGARAERINGGTNQSSRTNRGAHNGISQGFNPNAFEDHIADQLARLEELNLSHFDCDDDDDDDERELIMDDLASDSDDFSRSSEDGWYYQDE